MINIREDGFFSVNTGICLDSHIDLRNVNQPDELINLQKQVIEGYLPPLSLDDVKANRHKYCHNLPEQMKKLKSLMEIHVEIHSIEVRIFEGSDFDFNSVGAK